MCSVPTGSRGGLQAWVWHQLKKDYHSCAFVNQYRAIELVGEIALAGDHQSVNMAECTLDRLFGANLPAKYWVNGSLALTDSIVNTEFYDAGPVSLKQVVYIDLSVLNTHRH